MLKGDGKPQVCYVDGLVKGDILANVKEVYGQRIVANGPSDLCVFSKSVVDSLGSPHGYNQEICELTGADYVGVYGDGTLLHKGQRPPFAIYGKAPLVKGLDAFINE